MRRKSSKRCALGSGSELQAAAGKSNAEVPLDRTALCTNISPPSFYIVSTHGAGKWQLLRGIALRSCGTSIKLTNAVSSSNVSLRSTADSSDKATEVVDRDFAACCCNRR